MTTDVTRPLQQSATASEPSSLAQVLRRVEAEVDARAEDLLAWRRDIHQQPEICWTEHRTTELVAGVLSQAGASVRTLPGTGAVVDLGHPEPKVRIALRADLDALPIEEVTDLPFASRTPGACHACGHDVHTVGLLGAGLALRALEEDLQARGLGVRLVFQPAEETHPGGALKVMDDGVLEGVDRMLAVHCDPSVDVGSIGLRVGPITAASDQVHVVITGRGGHTSRPHLTQDITYALAKVVTDVPAALTRRLDPRAAAVLVWGVVRAGAAANVIPAQGEALGTLRMLDAELWEVVEPIFTETVEAVVAPYGVTATVHYTKGVPPVDNENSSVVAMSKAAMMLLGAGAVQPTKQSMGGEDLGWYLQHVPGAMARLGTRTPGGPTYELHQGDLVVDERSVLIAAKLLAGSVFTALSESRA
ncbi:peptidase M20D, amidohydrolase [Serinicoccus hydrothermalis]|uniref:Peptidase M20D, amidohydrolase n=1 Tax=Serinicoccus hydrothermalis TaxID=1758689 RepID=A0A1B1NGB9_9MICO|nr:amidohydrolase [Serinicoccus hydrothermalis]ANS80487.1 peptidase M20D, amidohydrolase [Serinicoccus hydrothermalis]